MSRLTVKMRGNSPLNPAITVDGKDCAVKRNQYGNKTVTVDSNSDYAEIRIFNVIAESSPLWVLYSLFFFFISVFGIFDVRENRKCFVIDVTIKVRLYGDTDFDVAYLPLNDGAKAVEIACDGDYSVENNVYSIDETAKKRRKIMLLVKIALWIALAVGIVLGFLSFIG